MNTDAVAIDTRHIAGYRRMAVKRALALGGAFVVMLWLVILDLSIGPSGMPLSDVISAILAGPHDGDRAATTIIWYLRMPQSLMAVVVGMCLGIAGLQMQTILDNPLASPFTLGFSAAAGFGAALSIMFGAALPLPEYLITPIAAFAMTIVACLIVYGMVHALGETPEILVLCGIGVLFLFQSLQSLLQYLASPEILQQIVFWLFGSLLKANWTSVAVTSLVAFACVPLILSDTWKLTVLRLGDANAASLGISVGRLRRRSFVLIALLTAAAVSFVGTIGFVGLVAPHVAKALVGEDHRFSIPLSAMVGAVILASASVFGKLISPGGVIPVGIITAVAGIPMLFLVIYARKRRSA
ncbi:iron-siderophore ABC transporter permease [Thalassospira sp. HJ]|uniref:FecCD family ABC transporter permease n=1 Tax=Thalassospira sp. HJ TaxID=1616823 RepID=UPI0005E0977C|nr:iron ABC transporter permease [Thalassospira sp. HJ]KJE34202.1 iron-siderophore ABC transporter permease [Thalassospira sp. HJ]